MKHIVFLKKLSALCLLLALRTATAQEFNVVGTVRCDGNPVAGAVVSDGERTAVTDAAGTYRLRSSKRCGYVFLSVPSGYEVEADGIIPRHFVPLAGEAVDRADFELVRAENDCSPGPPSDRPPLRGQNNGKRCVPHTVRSPPWDRSR